MKTDSERDRRKREFMEALDDAERIIKELRDHWNKVHAELVERFPHRYENAKCPEQKDASA